MVHTESPDIFCFYVTYPTTQCKINEKKCFVPTEYQSVKGEIECVNVVVYRQHNLSYTTLINKIKQSLLIYSSNERMELFFKKENVLLYFLQSVSKHFFFFFFCGGRGCFWFLISLKRMRNAKGVHSHYISDAPVKVLVIVSIHRLQTRQKSQLGN